jgi:hypothetical protein
MLASAAGADHVVNYRTGNAIEQVRAIAPEGVDIFVEVARTPTLFWITPLPHRTRPLPSTPTTAQTTSAFLSGRR